MGFGFGGGDFMGTPLSLGQFEFMAEAEGQDDLIDTPDARFNSALEEIRYEFNWAKGTDIDVTDEVNAILEKHDIDPATLSQSHIKRIEKVL